MRTPLASRGRAAHLGLRSACRGVGGWAEKQPRHRFRSSSISNDLFHRGVSRHGQGFTAIAPRREKPKRSLIPCTYSVCGPDLRGAGLVHLHSMPPCSLSTLVRAVEGGILPGDTSSLHCGSPKAESRHVTAACLAPERGGLAVHTGRSGVPGQKGGCRWRVCVSLPIFS